jgi:hypothetical protein
MALQNQTQQLRMSGDYRNHLLIQIELLRCVISHEELSKRLGVVTERCLARYVAGKTHLREDEFEKIAKALAIDARMLAQAWAASLGLRPPDKDAVSWMVDRAYRHWRRHSHLAGRRVPPSPSPMTSFGPSTQTGSLGRRRPCGSTHSATKSLHARVVRDSSAPMKCWSSLSMHTSHSAMSEQCTASAEYARRN